MANKLRENFEKYEQQELEHYKGMQRAEDLEKKLGQVGWYRVYRLLGPVNMIRCMAIDDLSVGCELVVKNDHATKAESELIAAVEAFCLMQRARRLRFLESQEKIRQEAEGEISSDPPSRSITSDHSPGNEFHDWCRINGIEADYRLRKALFAIAKLLDEGLSPEQVKQHRLIHRRKTILPLVDDFAAKWIKR